MGEDLIEVAREGELATLTLNRPEKRNALSIAVRLRIAEVLGELAADKTLRVLVLLSRGPIFCAGFDKSEFTRFDPEHVKAMTESADRYHRAVAEFPLPVVAGVQGPALGGGFDLATLADLRIATPQATFSHPEIKFGAPALFGPLREIIGGGLARDLVLTGRTIDAAEALRIGLVSRIVEPDQLQSACLATARQIAESPATTLRAMKHEIVRSFGGWDGYNEKQTSGGVLSFF